MQTTIDVVGRVRAVTDESELLAAVRNVAADGGARFAVGDGSLRPLSATEIDQLERQGNWAEDWSRLRVAEGFNPARVRQSTFHGDVVLGSFARSVRLPGAIELPSGVYRSVLVDCVVGHDALVQDVRLLVNYAIGRDAALCDCGRATCDGKTAFGNGGELSIAIETGGRDVPVFAEIDVEVAGLVARRRSDRELIARYKAAVAEYTALATAPRGIIDRAAVVCGIPVLSNTYVGPHALLDSATRVSDSTILSSEAEPVHIDSGACVVRSLIQWGSHVSTMAIVDSSVMTEHSHVERHGKVTQSILGPNTGVAEGEVTASLLGPFVGFHHQALLIAALWPEGKGNVGYGANVGSNHTGKAPDQEIWPGEGTFFGLGVNIKFPSDFTRAPYSVFATGVDVLPQKITFPFSLINAPREHYPGVSPAFNEIIPAWVLTDNMFALARNEGKYQARNKARRTRFDFRVFRPDTVDMMRDACRRLERVRQVREIYTDTDVEGLGQNFMLEVSRRKAIDAYQFYARYYSLLGLKSQVEARVGAGDRSGLAGLLSTASTEPLWEHQRRLLHDEFGVVDPAVGLRELTPMLERVAREVEQSKAKDDERGRRVIDDYADAHKPAAADSFVKQTWERTRKLVQEIEQLSGHLASH